MTSSDPNVLLRLYETIRSRQGADPTSSYTASLFDKGLTKITAKVSEEAGETVIAALAQDRDAVISESADLMYHLLVLWAARDVAPEDVFAALQNREGTSGHVEKAARDPKS